MGNTHGVLDYLYHPGHSQSDTMGSAQTNTMEGIQLLELPELVLFHIIDQLDTDSIMSLARTCKYMNSITPDVIRIKHKDFSESQGRNDSDPMPPTKWFDAPMLKGPVKRVTLDLKWKHQGWGGQEGRVTMQLMRNVQQLDEQMNEQPIAKLGYKDTFGIAPHQWEQKRRVLEDSDFIRAAQKGDKIRFLTVIGGGGGHSLHIKDFKCEILFIKRREISDQENVQLDDDLAPPPTDGVAELTI